MAENKTKTKSKEDNGQFLLRFWTEGGKITGETDGEGSGTRKRALEPKNSECDPVVPKLVTAKGGKARVPPSTTDTEEIVRLYDVDTLDPAAMRALADEKVEAILNVCRISGNLQGGCIKELKEAAIALKDVTSVALTRNVTEETLCLRRMVSNLRRELAEVKAEVRAMRHEKEAREAAPTPAEVPLPEEDAGVGVPNAIRAMQLSLQNYLGEINARLGVLEGRTLRPPLAAEKQASTTPPGLKPVPRTGPAPRPAAIAARRTPV